jgi:hypothetical protein
MESLNPKIDINKTMTNKTIVVTIATIIMTNNTTYSLDY